MSYNILTTYLTAFQTENTWQEKKMCTHYEAYFVQSE